VLGILEVRFRIHDLNPLNHASARLGIFEGYDGIACFVDKTSVAALEHSKVELNLLLSDRTISQQPIVILVHTQNASGCANDPELISRMGIGKT
jgi:hypothetical protein